MNPTRSPLSLQSTRTSLIEHRLVVVLAGVVHMCVPPPRCYLLQFIRVALQQRRLAIDQTAENGIGVPQRSRRRHLKQTQQPTGWKNAQAHRGDQRSLIKFIN